MSLVGWYPLNGTLKDLTGVLGDLTPTNTSVNTITNNGIVHKTYTNTSHTSGSLLSTNQINLGTNQSMFCWAYFDDIYSSASLNAIMGQHRYNYNGTNAGCNMGLTLAYVNSTEGRISVNTSSSTGRTYNHYKGNIPIYIKRWYHLGYTYDGSYIRLYVNGELDSIHAFSGMTLGTDYFGTHMWSLEGTALGDKRAHPNYCMTGRLNDVRVYNHTVSPEEVRFIAMTGNNPEVAKGLRFGVTFDKTVYNHAGYEQPYAISNITYSEDTLVGTHSGDFGTSGHVFTNCSSWGWRRATITAWIKMTATPSERACILIGGYYMTINSSRQLSVYCYGKTGNSNGTYWNGSKIIPLNQWVHIAAVWGDNGLQLYVNGEEDGDLINCTGNAESEEGADGIRYQDRKDIGYERNYGRQFSGLIGEVLMYHNDLSKQDIQSLYKSRQRIYSNGMMAIRNYNEGFDNELNEVILEKSQTTSKGVENANFLSEILQFEDGSYWIQLSHHNCHGGSNLFPANRKLDFPTKFVYNNDECWGGFHLIADNTLRYGGDNHYEFFAIENNGSQDTVATYRWTQAKNPLEAEHDEVHSSSARGLYRYHQLNGSKVESGSTFLRMSNGTPGNWFGAFGAMATHTQNGVTGIPNFSSATSGILDLYMRINPLALKYREFKGGIIMPTSINEI